MSIELPFTQADTLQFVVERWPERVAPEWRALKVSEEAGEVCGAMNKPWKGAKEVEIETAQLIICAMSLAEAVGFDLFKAVAEEWERAIVRVWPQEATE